MPYFNVGTVGAFRQGVLHKAYSVIRIEENERPAHGWYPSDAKGIITGPMVEHSPAVGHPGGAQPAAGRPAPSEPSSGHTTLHEMAAKGHRVVGGQPPQQAVDPLRGVREELERMKVEATAEIRRLGGQLEKLEAENAELRGQNKSLQGLLATKVEPAAPTAAPAADLPPGTAATVPVPAPTPAEPKPLKKRAADT